MSKQSENMMDLLKELALLKLDEKSGDATPSQAEAEARQNRRQKITDQIKALGGTAG